ncbi:MAG: DUF2779 domain-containing protein [Coriobacteriia bacterium]|nr:DUF2779 domain-containing protein [Coriobacteriia bacterium]
MRVLSKSRFQKGLQCEKALWLAVHRREALTPPSESQRWIFDQGSEVGKLAQGLFPGGVEVAEDHLHGSEALATTTRLLSAGTQVLYEPAFTFGGAFARVDILVARDDGSWDLYEVKSTASLKDVHITDAAVQAFAVEGAGLALNSINIVHIDTSYIYDGVRLDPEALFAIEDVTGAAREFMQQVPSAVSRLQAMLEGAEPVVRIGAQCTSPYPCDCISYCHAFLPADHPITGLPRIQESQLHSFLDAGVLSIADLPDDQPGLTEAQRDAVMVVKAGEPLVDPGGLARDLRTLRWPVYHLDFETFSSAVPLWAGVRPYQTIPFQYSVHVEHEDGRLEHREYLHRGDDDPRLELSRRLVADLDEAGSVVHYTKYERTQLAALADALPEYAPALAAVLERLFDLEPVIRNNTRHPASAGRSSIKSVLPAWCPDCSYAGMAIADGQTASVRYLRVVRGVADQSEAEATFRDLTEYCGLDTYAMVRLLREMLDLADG